MGRAAALPGPLPPPEPMGEAALLIPTSGSVRLTLSLISKSPMELQARSNVVILVKEKQRNLLPA